MQTNLTAVQGGELERSAGALTWWDLSGHTDLDALADVWTSNGLDEAALPKRPTALAALGDAVHDQTHGAHLLGRRLPGGAAWAIVRESVEGEAQDADLDYDVAVKAWIDQDDLLIKVIDPALAAVEGALRASYEYALDTLAVGALGGWLVKMASDGCNGTTMRRSGGFYYIPPDKLGLWREIAEAVEASGEHTIHLAPVVRSDELISAVAAAITREAEDLVVTVEGDLDEGDLGARALRTRRDKVAAMRAKLDGYRALVGPALDAVTVGLDELGIEIATLALQESAAASDAR